MLNRRLIPWLVCAAMLCGCASQTSLKGIEARLATKIKNTRDITQQAARDAVTKTNDDWAMRILAFGAVTTGLAYPVGKLLWCLGIGAGRKIKRRKPTVSE